MLIHSLALALCLGSAANAQQITPDFQYKFGNVLVPAADSDEPKLARFSSEKVRYHLDTGATLWAKQKQCVSCHTHGIYMLTRPALTSIWGLPPAGTRDFVVVQAIKIRDGDQDYGSAGVEMAYIARGLAAWDSHLGEATSSETDMVLRFLLAMQAEDGSIRGKDRWPPINSSTYHGTAMAAMAVADAPKWLAQLDDSELLGKIAKLRNYLRDTPPKNDHQRVLLLWASTYLPDLLEPHRREALMQRLWQHQLDDGGWSIQTFATPETLGGGKRAESLRDDPDYRDPASDAYQTGLAIVVLRDAGVSRDDARIQKAVAWLLSNQRESGRWWTRSLNRTSRFHFISYSGTAYAALALAKCDALPPVAMKAN